MSLSPINITFSVGTLPNGATYTPQQFLNALPSYLSGQIDASAFLPGGTSAIGLPGSDQGLYMDYTQTPPQLRVWSSTAGRYVGDQTEVPIGSIVAYAGATIPNNYLECIGQSVSVASYPDLYAALGGLSSPFTPVDGSNFTLPDLRGRAVIGEGTGSGLSGRTFATKLGAETTTIAGSNLPVLGVSTVGTSGSTSTAIASVNYSGTGTPISNMPPVIVLKYIIRAF
jgi:microcystin-dependent protein